MKKIEEEGRRGSLDRRNKIHFKTAFTTHINAAAEVLGSYAYTLAADGRRTAATEAFRPSTPDPLASNAVSYTYDDLNRLINETAAAQNGHRLHERLCLRRRRQPPPPHRQRQRPDPADQLQLQRQRPAHLRVQLRHRRPDPCWLHHHRLRERHSLRPPLPREGLFCPSGRRQAGSLRYGSGGQAVIVQRNLALELLGPS